MAKTQWLLKSRKIREVVHAKDQFAAWDTLRDRPAEDFGLVVTAEPNEQGEDARFPIRTSMLMFRWGRADDAKRFIALGIQCGMPDTTKDDRKAAKKK